MNYTLRNSGGQLIARGNIGVNDYLLKLFKLKPTCILYKQYLINNIHLIDNRLFLDYNNRCDSNPSFASHNFLLLTERRSIR